MGHAIRSKVVLERLVGRGDDVQIMASGRAIDFLRAHFPKVNRIAGLHMIYEDNQVRRGKTLWSNVLRTGLRGVPENVAAYFDLLGEFDPELVISDFESWTYLYGQTHRLPVISIDNMQIINRCRHPKKVIEDQRADFEITRAFVKGKLPGCEHYLIATFFDLPVRKKRTTLVPPILRAEILAARPTHGEHVLVYQTGTSHDALLAALVDSGLECRVYGVRRELTEEQVEGSLRFMPFSEERFVADLASCRAVIAGGGFTLMGEAVYLHKPMLSVPVGRQVEQVLNGRYLARAGFGLAVPEIDDPAIVHGFLAEVPRYQDALAGYRQDGNRVLYEQLDGLLDRAEAGVL
jgi:uncharacterized protein (TIGR00661 family)